MNLFFPYGIYVSGTKEFLRSLSGRGFVVHMFFVWYFNFQIPHFVVEICWPFPNFHFCMWRVKCLSHKQIRGLHLFWLWTLKSLRVVMNDDTCTFIGQIINQSKYWCLPNHYRCFLQDSRTKITFFACLREITKTVLSVQCVLPSR